MPDSTPPQHGHIDIGRLARDLRRRVRGQIRFSPGDRALYATDASNYRHVPIGVVVPHSVEDLAEAVRTCRDHGAPVLHRGGGTSLAGQCCNEAVVIDSSRWCNRVLEIDPDRRTARVEPGTVLDTLRDAAKEHGLTFGPDPSTHTHCTLGGMIGNNSAGVHSVRAGTTVDNVDELEVLTYGGERFRVGETPDDALDRIIAGGGRRGEIYRRLRDLRDRHADLIRRKFPDIPRRVSGYNLNELLPENGFNVARALVGTEGTCVSVLEAKLRLIKWHRHRVVAVFGFDDVTRAADCVVVAREHGAQGIEGIDHALIENMRKKNLRTEDLRLMPDGSAYLLTEFAHDDIDEACASARRLIDTLQRNPHVCDAKLLIGAEEQERLWKVREAGLGATAYVPGQERDTWPGWEDSAVAPDRLGDYIRDLYRLYEKYDLSGSMYGHFGDGLVHTRIDFGLHRPDSVQRFRHFLFDAAELVTRYGGSCSGEHGDGQARAELLRVMYGDEVVRLFEEFKAIWDPDNRMNPGIVVHPRPLDVDLRLGPRYHPPKVDTVFAYPKDRRSFSRAVNRCVGVGECRRKMQTGTMCPSFKATHEEKHSTRGRARLLEEMLQGDPIRSLWKSEAVHDALDLCLSCKGCKSDCPVNVDMATYKAEFMHHHYKGRLRTRSAYSLGLIHLWARAGSLMPWLPNWIMEAPALGTLGRRIAGIHPDRPVPRFARRSFRQDFVRCRRSGRPPVVLWADTFNNYFTPGPLHATAAVLDAAGFDVQASPATLCCGRPLYEFGMLGQARWWLKRCMAGLKEQLDAGAWIVGIEPSCVATFRDELIDLFPDDEVAKRLSERTLMLAEFLERIDFEPPRIGGLAIYHGHCYQKSVLGMNAEQRLMERAGIDVDMLDSGCCGMAGGFGYEERKYEVSRRIADLALLPRVKAAAPGTEVIIDGFSCRSQVKQLAGREPVTLPEILSANLDHGTR